MKKIFPFLLLLVSTTACRETVVSTANINIPVKLVVGCFINPQDDTLYATITLSKPLYKPTRSEFEYDTVKNATVQLSNGATSANFSYSIGKNQYILPTANFSIIPGQTYNLTVTTPTSERVTASTTVPLPQNFNFTLDLTKTDTNRNENQYMMDARWQGVPGPERFYRFIYGVKTTYDFGDYEDWPNSNVWNQLQFFSDDQQENRQFRFRETVYLGWRTPGSPAQSKVTALLQELDMHSFRYLTSLAAQINSSGGFSEPVVIYSNIENGLGCFGSSFQYKIQRDSL